jgi:hypothetical protein
MLRRLIVAGLAVGLAAPIFAITPASAAILTTCTGLSGTATLTPGLGHNQTAQSDVDANGTITGCNNGQTGGTVVTGSPATPNPTTTFPPRPIGCPVSLGGAGPDYADQTPILISADPGFKITWNVGPLSTGITKVKQSATTGTVRVLLVITAGQYAPPAGKKSKFKGLLGFTPTGAWECVDDAQRITNVNIANSGNFILQQV